MGQNSKGTERKRGTYRRMDLRIGKDRFAKRDSERDFKKARCHLAAEMRSMLKWVFVSS